MAHLLILIRILIRIQIQNSLLPLLFMFLVAFFNAFGRKIKVRKQQVRIDTLNTAIKFESRFTTGLRQLRPLRRIKTRKRLQIKTPNERATAAVATKTTTKMQHVRLILLLLL